MQRLCTPSSMSKTLCIKVLAVRLGKVQNLWAGGRRFLGGLVFSPVHRGALIFLMACQEGASYYFNPLNRGVGIYFATIFPKKCLKHMFSLF